MPKIVGFGGSLT